MLLDWELWDLRNSTFLNFSHISSEFHVSYCPECEGHHKSLCAFISTTDRLCCSLVSRGFFSVALSPICGAQDDSKSLSCVETPHCCVQGLPLLVVPGQQVQGAGGRLILGRVVLLMAK